MRRQELSEIHRQWLLAAVVKVAAEEGVSSLTTGKIAERAGVSRRGFYALFEDSEACLLAAMEQTVEWLGGAVVPAYRSKSDWRGAVRAGVSALLSVLEEERQLARLCIVDSLGAGPQVLRYRARVLEHLVREIDGARREQRIGLELDPPELAAEAVLGAALHLLHTRLLEDPPQRGAPAKHRTGANGTGASASGIGEQPLRTMVNPIMSMIVLPFLGEQAAQEELGAPAEPPPTERPPKLSRPRTETFGDLNIRLTYRTMRVLRAVASAPGSSNLEIADAAGIRDPGQISKLLSRLRVLGVIANATPTPIKGTPNVWHLTDQGERLMRSVGTLAEQHAEG
jgi:AcrR family transcriptional regulator/DNA-binding MarR family transcriptional regulator